MKPNLKRSLLLLLGGLLLVTPLVSQAAVDYVGQMYPGPNTDATERTVTEGDPSGLDVYIQAYKGGTTDSPGQGPGIECFISWDDPATDPDWNDIPTIYNKDIGNNDEYVGTIPTDSLAPGNYEYIGYCTDDGGTTKEYPENEGGNGTLIIEPFSLDGDPPTQAMHSMQPPAGDITTRAPGDTTPFEITVDFYQSGQTDAFGEGTNASCVVHWDGADGAADGNFGDTAMSYKEDSVDGYSDRYSVALDISALPEGSYGYTTRCDLGGAPYWYGDYNTPADGTLFIGTVSPPDITNMQPPAGDTTIIRKATLTTLPSRLISSWLASLTRTPTPPEQVSPVIFGGMATRVYPTTIGKPAP